MLDGKRVRVPGVHDDRKRGGGRAQFAGKARGHGRPDNDLIGPQPDSLPANNDLRRLPRNRTTKEQRGHGRRDLSGQTPKLSISSSSSLPAPGSTRSMTNSSSRSPRRTASSISRR